MTTPLKLIFAGAGEFGLPTLRALLDAGHGVELVITQPDRPAGRGRKMTPTPIGLFAQEHNLPLLKTANINEQKLPAADLLVVIAFGQKIAPHIIDHARLGSVNLHGSRLPKFRGAAPVNAAILAGDPTSGNSIIRLADRMDAGAVLAMSELAIGELETAGELHDRLAADGALLMLQTLESLATGQAVETIQDEAGVSIAKKIRRETAQIDFANSAEQIARQIRGLYPWPGCRAALLDHDQTIAQLTLVRARSVAPSTGKHPPGTINALGHVQTGDGALEIVSLKPDGGREMPLADFRRGRKWDAGMIVRSI